MDCSLPGSSVHGILQARILEWVPCPPPGDLPSPGIKPMSLVSYIGRQVLYHQHHPGSPPVSTVSSKGRTRNSTNWKKKRERENWDEGWGQPCAFQEKVSPKLNKVMWLSGRPHTAMPGLWVLCLLVSFSLAFGFSLNKITKHFQAILQPVSLHLG